MKRYLPIKVFSSYFGYGWWWGGKVYFIPPKSTCFAVLPISYVCATLTYESNDKIVGHGDVDSWSDDRQREAKKRNDEKF